MKPQRKWIVYSLLRVGIFAAVLTVLLLLNIEPWIAAVVAAIVGLCVTYIFFRGARDDVARSFYDYRATTHRDEDNEVENSAIDDLEDGKIADGESATTEGESVPLESQRGSQTEAEKQGRQAG